MANVKPFRARRVRAPVGIPNRPTTAIVEKVEVVDAVGIPAVQTPTDADILRAINELNRKIHQVSKNQQVIESKLNHLTTRLSAVDGNLLMGVRYLSLVMTSIGWWASGDTDMAEATYPSEPHWQ